MNNLRTVIAAIGCLVTPLTGLAKNATLITTFTNPTPDDDGTTKTLLVNPPTGNRFYRLHKP